MFGFLRPDCSGLWYRSLYSRCCQHQHLHYGKLALPMLSYESVFLYAAAKDAGAFGTYEPPARTCCLLRGIDRDAPAPDEAIGRFGASMTLLLASIKADDDVRDAQNLASRAVASLRRGLFNKHFESAAKYFLTLDESFEERVGGFLNDHAFLEEPEHTHDLATFTRPTAAAFSYVFSLVGSLPRLLALRSIFAKLGEAVGGAIIAYDCAQDWEADLRSGSPNPVRNPQDAQQALNACRASLAMAREISTETFGDKAVSARILSSVERRIVRTVDSPWFSCLLGPRESPKRGAVLNVTCCIPCGDGAILADPGECGKACCGCCCCTMCCLNCWPGGC